MVEGMRREDPVPTPQLAVPVSVPEKCHEMGNLIGSEKAKAEGDLALIAFYYLLRVDIQNENMSQLPKANAVKRHEQSSSA